VIYALAFVHVVSVVINEYSVIRHSFSLFEMSDTNWSLKFWNEYRGQELEHFGT
jgi:hypothetical protein